MSVEAGAPAIEIIPADFLQPLDISALFPRAAPLEVDLGSGEGSFLVAMAQRHPERNFLGIEKLLGRVQKTCRRAERLALRNARVLRMDSTFAARVLLPRKSVSVFHILFADPWPKRRHWPRRLIQSDFLDALSGALAPGGELRIKTNDAPYFQHIRNVLKDRRDLREAAWTEDSGGLRTDFEARFLALGLPIHRVLLLKN